MQCAAGRKFDITSNEENYDHRKTDPGTGFWNRITNFGIDSEWLFPASARYCGMYVRMAGVWWGVVVRPWLCDDFDDWLQRLKGPPHRCAFIFVDNSGIDIILGIFPFARLLLKRGTHVSLSFNLHFILLYVIVVCFNCVWVCTVFRILTIEY